MCFAHMFDTSGKVGAAECSEQIPFALDHRQFTSPTEASVGSVEPDEVCLDRATCSGRGLPELDNRRSLLAPLEVGTCNRGCLGGRAYAASAIDGRVESALRTASVSES